MNRTPSMDAPGTLRVVIVDDERQSRVSLRHALAAMEGMEIVAECQGGEEAIAVIREEEPDLVFLDIRMPDVDGFGVVSAVGPEAMPSVVFVTAHDVEASRAFDAAAVDYIHKPFDDIRLVRAVQRVRASRAADEAETLAARLNALLEASTGDDSDHHVSRFMVRNRRGVFFLPVAAVYWLEADGKHVKLHTDSETHRIRHALSGILDRLDPAAYVRVHRSHILRIDTILEVQPWFGGDHVALLRSGEKVRVSRHYSSRLLRQLS